MSNLSKSQVDTQYLGRSIAILLTVLVIGIVLMALVPQVPKIVHRNAALVAIAEARVRLAHAEHDGRSLPHVDLSGIIDGKNLTGVMYDPQKNRIIVTIKYGRSLCKSYK